MNKKFHNLRLNGTLLNPKELSEMANQKLNEPDTPQWEIEVFKFILEWLDENPIVEVHTSGSTGKPKKIEILKDGMITSAKMTGSFLNLKAKDNALLCLPANYIAGKMMIVRAFVLDLNLITLPPDSLPVKHLETDIDFAAMVPLQVQNSITNKLNFNRIKKLIIGGSSVSEDLINKLQFFKPECYSTFGMTETITHIAMRKLNHPKAEEWFTSMENVSIDINNDNCLTIHAPKLNPNILHTNDIIKIINPNQFIWLGRKDNIINSGGVKISPEQIEAKLSQKIYRRFFIYGIEDEKLGQKVTLFIEGRPLEGSCQQRFEDRIYSLLDTYEKPREIFYIPQFEETDTGKVKRKNSVECYFNTKS